MDPDRNGHISEKEWISCFEPAIKQREADGQKKMDFDVSLPCARQCLRAAHL